MCRLIVVTPTLSGQLLHHKVVEGVSKIHNDGWLVNGNPASLGNVNREIEINLNRHLCQKIVRNYCPKYVLLLDSDVVIKEDVLDKMLAGLKGHVASCIRTQPARGETHIITSCCLMRFNDYDMINYLKKPDECQCLKIAALGSINLLDCVEFYETARC
jgi:hypothetical protein